jgi:hypothetical protein
MNAESFESESSHAEKNIKNENKTGEQSKHLNHLNITKHDHNMTHTRNASSKEPVQSHRLYSPSEMTIPLLQRVSLILVVVAVFFAKKSIAAEHEPEGKKEWYKRYSHYPDYCSTPTQMYQRSIPPLKHDSKLGETRILHVTSIIRHGARTISKPHTCWPGFWESEETGVWDCDLTTILAPPTPTEILQEEGRHVGFKNAMFLFDKRYDAFQDPENGYSNVLNGTCELSQLILQGYEQEITNGKFLRTAYLYEEGSYEHDERMRLFDISDDSDVAPWDNHNLYLRSDDDQRTLLSGQILLQGLFGPELQKLTEEKHTFPTIPIHVADITRDILGGNEAQCPRLKEIRTQNSPQFRQFYNSRASQSVRGYMDKHLSTDKGLLDCLMTTVCTDRPLPESISASDPLPNSWLNRISTYVSGKSNFSGFTVQAQRGIRSSRSYLFPS